MREDRASESRSFASGGVRVLTFSAKEFWVVVAGALARAGEGVIMEDWVR